MCDHRRLDDPNGVRCVRDHDDDRGHVYESTAGSHVDDTHSDGGHG